MDILRAACRAGLAALVAVVVGAVGSTVVTLEGHTAAGRALPLRVASYGDSIALGIGSPGNEGWRPGISRRLDAAGIAHQWIGDGARSNWDVQGVHSRVLDWLNADQPDVVLLYVGTNNAAGACGVQVCAGMTNFTVAYRALVDRILGWSPTVKLIVGTVAYSNIGWSLNQVNVNIAVITQGGWHPSGRVGLAYTNRVHRCTLTDNIHPGSAGYQWMADLWSVALLPTLGAPAPVSTNPDTDERPGFEMGATSPWCRNMP